MDLSAVQSRDDATNLQEAFDLAEKHLNVPKLLEPEGDEQFSLLIGSVNAKMKKCHAGFSVGFPWTAIARVTRIAIESFAK